MAHIQRRPGALTFRPVCGGRLRCNQDLYSDKPPMSAKQAEALRKEAFNKEFGGSKKKRPKKGNSLKAVREITAKRNGSALQCPFCKHQQRFPVGQNKCPHCQGRIWVRPEIRSSYY